MYDKTLFLWKLSVSGAREGARSGTPTDSRVSMFIFLSDFNQTNVLASEILTYSKWGQGLVIF